MDEKIEQALLNDRIIDITTTGRKSGLPRRIEIWFQNIDGEIYISGSPGRRGWYANLVANPEFTFHLKESLTVDLQARANPITNDAIRREIFPKLDGSGTLEDRIAKSCIVKVIFI